MPAAAAGTMNCKDWAPHNGRSSDTQIYYGSGSKLVKHQDTLSFANRSNPYLVFHAHSFCVCLFFQTDDICSCTTQYLYIYRPTCYSKNLLILKTGEGRELGLRLLLVLRCTQWPVAVQQQAHLWVTLVILCMQNIFNIVLIGIHEMIQ